jgi:hypothetical protein
MITGRKILPLFYIHVRVLSFLEGTVEALFSSINTQAGDYQIRIPTRNRIRQRGSAVAS